MYNLFSIQWRAGCFASGGGRITPNNFDSLLKRKSRGVYYRQHVKKVSLNKKNKHVLGGVQVWEGIEPCQWGVEVSTNFNFASEMG